MLNPLCDWLAGRSRLLRRLDARLRRRSGRYDRWRFAGTLDRYRAASQSRMVARLKEVAG